MKIEQIDKDIYTCNISDEKSLQGVNIRYTLDTFGTSEDMAKERVMLALIEMLLTIEAEIQKISDHEED